MTDLRAIALAPLLPPNPYAEVDLPELAAHANAAHRAACEAWEAAQGPLRLTVGNMVQAGRALSEAKRRVKHGQWLAWLAEHCPDIPSQRASDYMRIADAYYDNALEIPSSGNIPLSRLVAALPKRRARGRKFSTVEDPHPVDLVGQVADRLVDLDQALSATFGAERLPGIRVAAVNAYLDGLDDPDFDAVAPALDGWAHAILDALE